MKNTLLIFILIIQVNISSQTVLLHQDVSKLDFQMPSVGPNYKNFHQMYINYGLAVPTDNVQEVEINIWSPTFSIGWRYKRKLSSWVSIGTAVSYINSVYSIKQTDTKQIPNNIQHSKEKLKLNSANCEIYTRINFGQRGNVIGKFIDIGAYADYAFNAKHFYCDKADKSNPPYYSGRKEVINRDLNYINRFNYGLRTRIGINRWVLVGSYRLTDLLTNDYKDLKGDWTFTKYSISLEIGLHK